MYQCIIYIYIICMHVIRNYIYTYILCTYKYVHICMQPGMVKSFVSSAIGTVFFFEKLGGNVRKAVVCLERVEFNVINRDMKWEYL